MAAIRQCQASETCTPRPPPARIRADSPSWRHNLPNLIPLWAFMINGVTVVWQSAAVAFGFDCQKRERQERNKKKKKIHPCQTSRPRRVRRRFLFPSPAEDLRCSERHETALSSPHTACRVASKTRCHFRHARRFHSSFPNVLEPFFGHPELTSVAVFAFYENPARQILILITCCNDPDPFA